MTAFREVIVWIAIAFFVVSSAPSVIEENRIGVCATNVSVNVFRTESYIETYKKSCWKASCYGTFTRRVLRTTYELQWRTILICCEGYKLKNKTCEPQCSSPCINGYCAKPNTCTCNPGWGGDLCDKPLCATYSVSKEDNCTVCYKNMSRKESRNISYEVPYSEKWYEKLLSLFKSTPDLVTIQKLQHFTTWDKECCSGYGKKTGICECSMGWGGNFCNESLLCFIILPDQVNDSKNEIEEMKNSTDKLVNEWMGHFDECLPECLNQMNMSSFVNITQSENRNLFFIPKNLTCNTIPTRLILDKKYIIGAVVIGITILIATVVGAVYIVRRKKKGASHTLHDTPTEVTYNDVGVSPIHVYDYVDSPRFPVYDDVEVPPHVVYEEVTASQIPEYLEVLPNIDYDDVNRPIEDYDEVYVGPIQWSFQSNPRVITVRTAP